MKQPEPEKTTEGTEGSVHPETLLELWMGEASQGALRRSTRRLSRGAAVGLAAVGAVAVVVMAKYAIDLLAILLVLAAAAVLLRVLGLRLAESEILPPLWFLIVLLGGTLVGYAYLVPSGSDAAIGKYMPGWMVEVLQWSESRGWARRVIVAPGDEYGTVAASGNGVNVPAVRSPEAIAATAGTAKPLVVVLASDPITLEGTPITLTASVPAESVVSGLGEVKFYDGGTLLGTAVVRTEGRRKTANLTVRGLTVGQHEIRAELTGPRGAARAATSSEPLRHTVLRRAR